MALRLRRRAIFAAYESFCDNECMNVERLLEKYYLDIRHVETERHWFLGAYAIAAAGVLAFLAQDVIASHRAFGFGVLGVLSVLGCIHAIRAARILGVLQKEAGDVVDKWQKDPDLTDQDWRTMWKWPTRRDKNPPSGWLWGLINWHFSALYVWVYVLGAGVFLYLLVRAFY